MKHFANFRASSRASSAAEPAVLAAVSGPTSVNPRTLLIVLVVAVVIYVLSGLYQIDQQERGVVFRFGAVKNDVVMRGCTGIRVSSTRCRRERHACQLDQAPGFAADAGREHRRRHADGAVGDRQPASTSATKVRDPENSLENAAESALRHVVGSTQMDDVITEGRAAIAVEVGERLQDVPEPLRHRPLVSKANIDQSVPPKQVQDAFDDVQRAKEDQQARHQRSDRVSGEQSSGSARRCAEGDPAGRGVSRPGDGTRRRRSATVQQAAGRVQGREAGDARPTVHRRDGDGVVAHDEDPRRREGAKTCCTCPSIA
jgi:membrane protease subunit HflK